MPKILYFPTAFFDLPNRICLNSENEEGKEEFFKFIVQDILDSMNQSLDINTHIVERINNGEHQLIRQLSLEMSGKINEVILAEWKKVLNDTQYSIGVEIYKEDQDVYLGFNVEGPDGVFKLSERSLGFRWFFMFLLLTQFRGFRKNENKHIIFMFDEPAANLSNRAQKQLLKSLERISKNCTIIYTTHSHNLVNLNWLEGAHVVSNDALEKGDLESFNSKNTNIKLEKYRNYVNSYPQNVSYFQPILDVLEYIPNELDFELPSVIVEGKNDFYTLKYFFELLGIKDITTEFCLVPGMSCSNVDTLISLLYSWGKEYIVLLDSDVEAKNNKKRYEEVFGGMVENKIFTLDNIDITWKKSLESLLTDDQKLKIQNKSFPSKKYIKTKYNRAIQELLMTGKQTDIGEDVLSNFRKFYEFLKDELTDR